MRTFTVISKGSSLHNQYITEGIEYTLNQLTDMVYYCRNQVEVSCSYMPLHVFKRALRDGSIRFTD